MAPTWMTVVAWCALTVAALSALWIATDIIRGYRMKMGIMNVVWPVTALYMGPVAIWGYRRFGRPTSARWQHERGVDDPPATPRWSSIALGTSHCGAGCTLADIIVPWGVFTVGATIAGRTLFAEFAAEYLAALALGILFQYWAIAPMRGLGLRDGLLAAAKADVLSLTAFQIGMFVVMAMSSLVIFADAPLEPTQAAYWLVMQIGMIVGFATAWPANAWLVRKGIKEAM